MAEDPNRFFTEWDDVVDASIPRMIATQDAVILGRRGYDEWVGFWPGTEIERFATSINGVAKHVATSSPVTAHPPPRPYPAAIYRPPGDGSTRRRPATPNGT